MKLVVLLVLCVSMVAEALWALIHPVCRQLETAVAQEDYSRAQQLKQQADVSLRALQRALGISAMDDNWQQRCFTCQS